MKAILSLKVSLQSIIYRIDLLRRKVLGPSNQPQQLYTNVQLDAPLTVTLLTTLDMDAPHPVIVDVREESNTAVDFLNILVYWIENGYLIAGDFLIVDNATVHVADEIWDAILALCSSAGISFRLLPCYSPELNPCELVFGFMKNYLRKWRGDDRFWLEILHAVAQLTYSQLVAFYHHCMVLK